MADYTLPKYAVSRLRYHDGQFLMDQDFADEQIYHMDQRRRHDRLLHVAGIAEGLTITIPAASEGRTLEVSEGTAVDDLGRLILLRAKRSIPVEGLGGPLCVQISFREVADGAADPNNAVESATRFTQEPDIKAAADLDAHAVVLGWVTAVNGQFTQTEEEKEKDRVYSGVRLPRRGGAYALRARGDTPGGVELNCSLSVVGDVRYTGRLSKLDVQENQVKGVAEIRVYDLKIGHSTRRGTRFPDAPLGRALVDHTDTLRINYDSDWPKVGIQGDEGIGFHQGGKEVLTIIDGKVGIGTKEPGAPLHVPLGGIQIGASATVTDNFHLTSDVNGPRALRLYGGNFGAGSHLLTVTSSGNVGIGTVSPAGRLDVAEDPSNETTSRHVYLRVHDLWLGHSSRGSSKKGRSVGRALVDQDTRLTLNYDSDWQSTTIGGTEGILLATKTLTIEAPTSPGTTTRPLAKVGIGTGDPRAGLEINRGDTNSLALMLSSSGEGWGSGLQLRNTPPGGVAKNYGIYAGFGSLHFVDVDKAIDRMRVDTDGKVWIGGELTVDGTIKGKASQPLREQLVHRRIVYGLAGDTPREYGGGLLPLRDLVYGPFGYATPAPQAGARRRTRLYAIYSDNIESTSNETRVRFGPATENGPEYVFKLGHTWGDIHVPRDGYSDWIDGQLPGGHMPVYIYATGGDHYGTLWYLEIQTWDFFD